MDPAELKERTIPFAVRVLKFSDALPHSASERTVSNQIARSGCSVAANHRAALRGKSRADFINKITTVLEEADGTDLWIEIARRAALVKPARVEKLRTEAIEPVKIFNATRTTTINVLSRTQRLVQNLRRRQTHRGAARRQSRHRRR